MYFYLLCHTSSPFFTQTAADAGTDQRQWCVHNDKQRQTSANVYSNVFQCFFACFVFTMNVVEVELSKQTRMTHESLKFKINNLESTTQKTFKLEIWLAKLYAPPAVWSMVEQSDLCLFSCLLLSGCCTYFNVFVTLLFIPLNKTSLCHPFSSPPFLFSSFLSWCLC